MKIVDWRDVRATLPGAYTQEKRKRMVEGHPLFARALTLSPPISANVLKTLLKP